MDPDVLEEKIAKADAKLEKLETEIQEIGQPAGRELLRRLELLKVEEKALKRNFEELRLRGEPDSVRLEKIEILLQHIEMGGASVKEDADFLQQAAPSSMTLAVEAGAKMVDLYRKGLSLVLGDHHPLGSSVFVNHSHDHLSSEFGLDADKEKHRDG
jgi:chromosome segregation ATPase